MNCRATLAVVLSMSLLLLCAAPSLAQPNQRPAHTTPPAVRSPAEVADPLVFHTQGHAAGFTPGRACLAALDHALCVEFVGGTPILPRAAAGSGGDPVRYHGLWLGIDLVYSTAGGGLVKAPAVATTTFNGAGHTGGFYDGFETGWDDWFPRQPDLLPYDRVDYRTDDGYTNSVRLGTIEGELEVQFFYRP